MAEAFGIFEDWARGHGLTPTEREYVSRTRDRLLWCLECGEPMRVKTTYGHAYYHCRLDVTTRCRAKPVREDVLAAWATALFDRLEGMQPSALVGAVRGARARREGGASGSIEAAEAALGRLEKLWLWGHVKEPEYMAQRRHLEELRAELARPRRDSGLLQGIEGIGQA